MRSFRYCRRSLHLVENRFQPPENRLHGSWKTQHFTQVPSREHHWGIGWDYWMKCIEFSYCTRYITLAAKKLTIICYRWIQRSLASKHILLRHGIVVRSHQWWERECDDGREKSGENGRSKSVWSTLKLLSPTSHKVRTSTTQGASIWPSVDVEATWTTWVPALWSPHQWVVLIAAKRKWREVLSAERRLIAPQDRGSSVQDTVEEFPNADGLRRALEGFPVSWSELGPCYRTGSFHVGDVVAMVLETKIKYLLIQPNPV